MITAIEIENFKAIRDRVRFELKPITLLFGANSSGKSTIVQALHYAREIFERRNLDPDRTSCGGDAVDLGGFKNLVHNRDDTSRAIELRFDLDLTQRKLPEYQWGVEGERLSIGPGERGDINPHVSSAWVRLMVFWVDQFNAPEVLCYEVGMNDRVIARTSISEDGAGAAVTDFDFQHPVFKAADQDYLEYWGVPVLELLKPMYESQESGLALSGQRSALPVWGKLLNIPHSFHGEEREQVDWFLQLLSQILVGPGELLRDALVHFRYLGPLRELPPRNYEPPRHRDESRWATGMAAWDALYRGSKDLVANVSDWLFRSDRLNSGYELRVERFREIAEDDFAVELDPATPEFDERVSNLWWAFQGSPTKSRLTLLDATKRVMHPRDVGVGISQLLPVVVAALDKEGADIVAVEQPELHLHPALQTRLGDLFIESAFGEGKNTLLIETHSEHLILRLLRRIRETTEGTLPANARPLRPDQVSVTYVEQTEQGVQLSQLRIDETGEFIDRWPKGFFEERADELF